VIFGIGLNKTGTTTLGDAGELLGLSRLGWCKESHVLHKAWRAGDIDALRQAATEYDLLEDWPWPLVYKEMAESFPDSRFVLTRRTSAAVWFKSQRHHIKKYGPHRGIYGDMTEKEAPEKYQAFYENHLREARSYFAGTGRMLEVCWDEGDGWEQLCPFLGRPIPDIAFPHSNPTPTFSRRVKTRIHALGK
jgi:Sulfotransferase domain